MLPQTPSQALNFPLCLKSFRGMFQSLKSYRFAYISVICINVICDFVVVLVSFTSYWSSSKLSRPLWHFDMSISITKLERTGSGYKCVWQFTFTQIYHYHQCLNVGMAVRRPLGVKWAIKRAESHCSSTTMIGGAAFHENLTWSVSIPFFLVKNVLKA